MSEYDLIPEEAYENLPEEANDRFAVLVRIAQTNLARLLDQSNSNDFSTEIRSQFISIISGIAEALGIEGLPEVRGSLADYDQYQTFQIYLAGVVAKVRLQGNLVSKPFSVGLGRVTKARIQQQIDQLRLYISNSDVPESKKTVLIEKLEELETELAKTRLSFARTMAIAASIMTVIGSGTTALANASEAKDTVLSIIHLIGEDKEKEEEERRRLSPPPKALPDHSAARARTQPTFDSDLDDDVPF